MRKSPEQIKGGNGNARKLIQLLFIGIMAFAPCADSDTNANPDNSAECERCKSTRDRMLQKFREIRKNASEKTQPTEPGKSDKNPSKKIDLNDCDSCQFA